MKSRLLTSILALLIINILVGCSKEGITAEENQEDGALALSITRADQSTDYSEETTLRIYNSNDRLIARYSGEEIPQALYLAAGSYRATVQIGEEVELSQDVALLSYYGEKEFTIVGGEVNNLDINCTIQNTIVAVNFDQTIFERFEIETSCYLCIANSFSMSEAQQGEVPTLHFSDSGEAYFILPDGVDNIAWGFYGESAHVDSTAVVESTTVEVSGAIENPAAATKYTLNFVYTLTPDGYMGVTITVDESVDEYNDLFNFSPQPTITGDGFNISDEGLIFDGVDRKFKISSMNSLYNIEIYSKEIEGETIKVMEQGTLNSVAGVEYVATDEKSGELTLSHDLFALFATYGTKTIRISVEDMLSSEGHEDMEITVSGTESPTLDLWSKSLLLSAQVLLLDVSEVKFALRKEGDELWEEVVATKGSDNSYTALIEPTWSEAVNEASLTTYTAEGGVAAAKVYEYRVIIDESEHPSSSITTDTGDTISNGDMESSEIKAFSTSSSSSSDWTSGNNTFSSDLCSQVTKGGSSCAYLKSRTAVGVFAAGNLNYGQFEMSGFSGSMRFGQALSWQARPRALRFRYAATIGDETHDDNDMLDGKDKARVYFAIVDWSDRHTVTAGTSGNPTGAWDPALVSQTDEGNIIGYASFYIEDSINDGEDDDLVEVEIPILYYDTATRPTKAITMVLSCAASAYGDYMTGSTDSRLWVDDFELLY